MESVSFRWAPAAALRGVAAVPVLVLSLWAKAPL